MNPPRVRADGNILIRSFLGRHECSNNRFCKFYNVFSTKINNYNTNDKLIKLLINKNEYKVQTFNNNNNITHFNNQLIDEIDILKDIIQKQKKEISDLNKTKNDSQKYLKIVEIIKNTKRKTLLYMDVKDIIKS